MTQNENTNEVEVELQDNESVDETFEIEDETITEDESIEPLEEETKEDSDENLKLKNENAKLRRLLAKKDKTTQTQAPQKQSQTTSQAPQYLTRDEGVLLAQGYDDTDLDTLKAIAKGKGINLLKAKDDVLFTAYFEKKQADSKRQKAALGASRGSGTAKAKPEPKTREEHMEAWKEKMGLN